MRAASLVMFLLLFLVCTGANSHADMITWVDKNGVRHYSNTDAPPGNANSANMEEFKPQDEETGKSRNDNQRDRFSVLKMYEEDRKRYMEEKKQAEFHRYNENVKQAMEASERAAREKREQLCQKAKDRYDKLRSLGWRNYAASPLALRDIQDKVWIDNQGRVIKRELDNRQEKAWKEAYDKDLERQEKEVRKACSRN